MRDSYGVLRPMQRVKKKIDGGEEIGPRTYLAGNIVGWGGTSSEMFSGIPDPDVSFFEEQLNDEITLGSGEEWARLTPDELRIAVNAYLDYSPDFIKYGGTHDFGYPSPIMFSPRAQRVIVEETHKRGLVVETHSTSLEGLRLSVLDLIQHPEILGNRVITDELVELIVDRDVVCSMLTNNHHRKGLGGSPSSAGSGTRSSGHGVDEYGTRETGKAADIVVLDADPLANSSNIRRLALVMKGGRIIDIDALPTNPIAEEISR